MQIRIIRTDRKSFYIKSELNGFIVRVPQKASNEEIEKFLTQHSRWIENQKLRVQKLRTEYEQLKPLSKTELIEIKNEAKKVICEKVEYYANQLGVSYGRITIRTQRSRWASCGVNGNLNFNAILMLAPKKVLDSVIVHELCHIKVRNHSDRFYAEVLRIFPDYWICDKWLKENGDMLMMKMMGMVLK